MKPYPQALPLHMTWLLSISMLSVELRNSRVHIGETISVHPISPAVENWPDLSFWILQ